MPHPARDYIERIGKARGQVMAASAFIRYDLSLPRRFASHTLSLAPARVAGRHRPFVAPFAHASRLAKSFGKRSADVLLFISVGTPFHALL